MKEMQIQNKLRSHLLSLNRTFAKSPGKKEWMKESGLLFSPFMLKFKQVECLVETSANIAEGHRQKVEER
jgi:hypothetical protein